MWNYKSAKYHSTFMSKINFFKKIFLSVAFSLPFLTFAQLAGPAMNGLESPKNLTQFVNNFITILNPMLFFIAGFGFFGLITGILKYVGAGGDEERLGKAKQLIVYGLIGMLIIFSFWGIVNLFARSYLGVK